MTVAVSGSFRRAMGEVQEAVSALADRGVVVLSPADPRVVDQFEDFLFVASDYVRAPRLVQNRHLAAIEAADFVWLVAPDGYVGLSAAMEVGFAMAHGVPVYSTDVPTDLTIRQYVIPVESLDEALRYACVSSERRQRSIDVLLDPVGIAQSAHDDLELITHELSGMTLGGDDAHAVGAAERIRKSLSLLR